MTLEVLISTLGTDGIARVAAMDLPRIEGVSYLIGWQMPDGMIPAALDRRDIKIIRLNNKGLSRNRNYCLDNATGDILLIADDDLKYTSDQLQMVRETFEVNAGIDIATFMYSGDDAKHYPRQECDLSKKLPAGYYVTSFEIAIRRNPRTARLRFNEKMGLGAPVLHAGEEELFLLSARKAGLVCRFFPKEIAHHEGLTTGNRPLTPGVGRASGAYIALAYPFTSLPRILLKSWRLRKNGQSGFFSALWHQIRGLLYAAIFITPPWSPRYKYRDSE